MANKYTKLFEPLQIKDLNIKNRIVMPPMVTQMGVIGKQSLAWYRERAKGGVGTVIVEATPIYRFKSSEFLEGLKELVEAIHSGGAIAAIQLFHGQQLGDGDEVGPSATNGRRAVTLDEIKSIINQFAYAAMSAKEVGFDAVEPHGAHGFFLNQFFSPRTNKRDDSYGGNLTRRMRLALDIVDAVRRVVGNDFVIFYRHTAMQEGEDGYSIEDSQKFAIELLKAGVDVMDISPSTSGRGTHADLAAAIKQAVNCPVIAVGGMNNPETASDALGKNKCDLVAIGRGLIADAHWPEKVAAGKFDEIIECVECNEKCFGNLQAGIPIGCTQNPESGLEYQQTFCKRSVDPYA